MKRILNAGLFYTIIGLVAGVFYREFTKFNSFTDWSPLNVLHTHALALGMFGFLIVLILDKLFALSKDEKFNRFYYVYNIGLISTLLMMLARGVLVTLNINMTTGMDAAISGIAGIAHIILAAGIIRLFLILRRTIDSEPKTEVYN